MSKICRTFLFWTLILTACAAGVTASPATPAQSKVTPSMLADIASEVPIPIGTVSTPHIDQPPDGNLPTGLPDPQTCGFQWANQELPELSSSFETSIQALQPEARAIAYAFGENCIREDGSNAGFGAKETDFDVILQVNNLTDESALGTWIVKVMQVIEQIPQDQMVGPGPSRVSISFASNGDQKFVQFYVNQYQALPVGSDPAEIYKALQVPQ